MATSGPDAPGISTTIRQAPLHIFTGHKDEGYALDWSPITAGRLLSGMRNQTSSLLSSYITCQFLLIPAEKCCTLQVIARVPYTCGSQHKEGSGRLRRCLTWATQLVLRIYRYIRNPSSLY